jgi:hypothetical protein
MRAGRIIINGHRASTQNAYISMYYITNCGNHLLASSFVYMLETYLVDGVGGGMQSASFKSKR